MEKKLTDKLTKLSNYAIADVRLLEGAPGIYIFDLDDDESSGLFSSQIDKVILPPGLYSNFEVMEGYYFISFHDNNLHDIKWIDFNGNVILSAGEIIKVHSNNVYQIKKREENFSKDQIHQNGYLYFHSLHEEEEGKRKYLVADVIDSTEDESGKYLMVLTDSRLNGKKIGIFDLNRLQWIVEPVPVK